MAVKKSPDIVYVVRSGDENEELRYSLRSLQQVPHGTVHIAGYAPSFLNGNLNRIPVAQHPNKFRSAELNLLAAIESSDVSDPFWLFNDDFFLMKKMRSIPHLHRGDLQKVIDHYTERHSGDYLQGLIAARDLLRSLGIEDPLLCYEMHSPMLVHKQKMADAIELRGKQNRYMLRTVYGNLIRQKARESADVKVYRNAAADESYKQWPMLSTSDVLFRYSHAGRYIREQYPDRSSYER